MARHYRIIVILGFLALSGLVLQAQDPALPTETPGPTDEPGRKAVLFRLEGQLSQTMPTTLKRAIALAKTHGAETLIIEIDTPGGEMTLMEQLRDMIFDAHQNEGLDTCAFIHRNADSAGALIAMACRSLYMSPLSHIGSATPVAINPLAPFLPDLPEVTGQEDMMKKVKSRARSIFRATAIETGRNSDVAEAMVDPDIELIMARADEEEQVMSRQRFHDLQAQLGQGRVSELFTISPKGDLLNMTAREGMEWGFIEGIPETREELLADFLDIPATNLILVKQSWSEALVHFIESIHILLLIAGLVLLYVEFQVPGFGVPGILGLAFLALLFFGKWMAGLAEFTEILMVILGLALIAVEIFVIPGTFVAGILGALLIGGGLILSFQPFILPDSPWQADMLKDNLFNLSLSVVIVLVSSALLSKFLPKNPIFRRFVLDQNKPGTLHGSASNLDDVAPTLALTPGTRGIARSDLRPAGKVLIQEVLLDAQTEGGFIEADTEVEVVRITGNFVFVRKVKENRS